MIEGSMSGRSAKVVIVASKFNIVITRRLLKSCVEELVTHNVKKNNITVIWVPGAYEIPVVAAQCAKKKNVQAVICLGAVLRGETLHYELVAEGVAYGIMKASLMTGKPVIFGVLAADTLKLADKRSSARGYNKGRDAALAALEMIDVLKRSEKAVK